MSAEKSATPQGQELIDGLRRIDTCLAEWLLQLADFDTWGTLMTPTVS